MSIPDAVVIDANILVSICSKEKYTYPVAIASFNSYAQKGWEYFAPNLIVAEVLFALCVKFQSDSLTRSEYEQAIRSFSDLMQVISTPSDEASLIDSAVRIRGDYVCKRTSDSVYIAFAEELAKTRVVELATFDAGIKNQITNFAPTVTINLLKT